MSQRKLYFWKPRPVPTQSDTCREGNINPIKIRQMKPADTGVMNRRVKRANPSSRIHFNRADDCHSRDWYSIGHCHTDVCILSRKTENCPCKLDIKTIEEAIRSYSTESNGYPDTLADVNLAGMKDPWGNPYQYLNIAGQARAWQGPVKTILWCPSTPISIFTVRVPMGRAHLRSLQRQVGTTSFGRTTGST